MPKKYLLFDFDGVIAESFAPAFEVAKLICPNLAEDDYRRRFEGNINDVNEPESLHSDKCRHDIDFFTEYIPRIKERVKLVPGIAEIIKKLAERYTLVIISSTISLPIAELLEKYDLRKCFVDIFGNDVHKSKVEKIRITLSKHETSPDSCVFITDTLGDIREAAHMDIGAIAVSWGFHTRETLEKGKPFIIIDKVEELMGAVDGYFGEKIRNV